MPERRCLQQCIEYARWLDCQYILFHSKGQEDRRLPTYRQDTI
jgi:hypothetical protein